MRVPDLRLLGYAPTRPMLRIVRLPDATHEPAPVSLDTGNALDSCVRRDGWLAFTPASDVYGVPLPFGERPFRIARDTRVVAAGADPRTVWLGAGESSTIAEYDGIAREVRRELELPGPAFSVAAATASGFVLVSRSGLHVWEPPKRPQLMLDGSVGPDVAGHGRLACLRLATDELVIVNLGDGSHVSVPKPADCRWTSWRAGVFSPDGAWLAVDLDSSPELSEEEAFDRVRQAVRTGKSAYEPQPHRLGIIRCADGALTIADGVFDNFANLAWSLDSQWIVLTTPFAAHGLWVTRRDEATLGWLSFGRRHTPSLLCDASDLVD